MSGFTLFVDGERYGDCLSGPVPREGERIYVGGNCRVVFVEWFANRHMVRRDELTVGAHVYVERVLPPGAG